MKEPEQSKMDLNDLVDIRDVNRSLPTEERIKSYVQQVKHPYDFRVGKVKVHISYAGESKTINDSFTDMIASL